MGYKDDYISRINATGKSVADTWESATKHFFNEAFKDSPFYKQIEIKDKNGIVSSVDVRVVDREKGKLKDLVFRPNTIIGIGSIAMFNDKNWLITDFNDNDIFPKAEITYCNGILPLSTPPSKTQVGTDPMGRPIYNTVAGTSLDLPCVVHSVREIFSEDDVAQITPVNGRIVVVIQNTVNSSLVEGKEFELFGSKYRIYGFDRSETRDDEGILSVFADKIT